MKHLPRRTVLAALLVSPSMVSSSVVDARWPALVLSGSQEIKDSPLGRWLQLIYGEALRRLGYRLVYKAYPLRRSSMMTDRGHADGEIHRIPSYGRLFPKLVRVDEAHFSSVIVAYAARPGIKIDAWSDLQRSGLTVGLLAGTLYLEDKLRALVGARRMSTPVGIDQGMRMLYAGRFDVLINVEDLVIDWLSKPHDASIDKSRYYRAGTLEATDFHAFLSAQHAALAPRLAETLRELKREGLIERYRPQALRVAR